MAERMMSKQNYMLTLTIRIVLVVIITLEVLFLSRCEFFRLDLTEDKLFTFTDSTKNILKDLKKRNKRVLIKAFFSRDVPEALKPVHERIREIIDEYVAWSDGMVVSEFLDPADDQSIRDEAERLGIQAFPISSAYRGGLSVKKVYQGLKIRSGDRQKVLDLAKPILESIYTQQDPGSRFEYLLTTAIAEITQDKKPKIALYAKSEVPPAMNPFMQRQQGVTYSSLKDILKGRFQIEEVEMKPDSKIPKDTSLLIVVKPKDFNDFQRFQVDQYLVKGGKAIFFVQEEDFSRRKMWKMDFKSGLEDLLKHFGVDVKKELVADGASFLRYTLTMPFRYGDQYVQVPVAQLPYPYWVLVRNVPWKRLVNDAPDALPGMNQDFLPVKKLKNMFFFWCNPVELLKDKLKNCKSAVLLRSSPRTLTESIPQSVDPGYDVNAARTWLAKLTRRFDTEKTSQVPLAVWVKGKFDSYFKGKKLPDIPEDKEGKKEEKTESKPGSKPASKPASKPTEAEKKKKLGYVEKGEKEAEFVVVGDSTFIEDGVFSEEQGSVYASIRAFVLNLVEWLALNKELIDLRVRNTQLRNFKIVERKENETEEQLEERERSKILLIRWGHTLAWPFLVIIFGLVFWTIRKARKQVFIRSLG